MYAKDIIMSDNKNAFNGKYNIPHVLDRLTYFSFVLLSTLQQALKILFQVLSSTGYREMEFTALEMIILIIKISQLFTPGLSFDTMHSVHHRDLLLITLIVVKYRSRLNVL